MTDNNTTQKEAALKVVDARNAYAADPTPKKLKALQKARRAYNELRDPKAFDAVRAAGKVMIE